MENFCYKLLLRPFDQNIIIAEIPHAEQKLFDEKYVCVHV